MVGGRLQIDRSDFNARKKGRALLQKACEGDLGSACFLVAIDFENGTGGPKDPVQARKYATIGCNLKDADSCYQAGEYWSKGFGGEVDEGMASDFFDDACYSGRDDACAYDDMY